MVVILVIVHFYHYLLLKFRYIIDAKIDISEESPFNNCFLSI